MDTLSHAELEHKYSWWWDSHICPKNSRWLQENLADMDSNIKLMIKLIEEDADSFARRAEMYFKKRPELMKLVEEFYRAYRALAERYDHATGELRQAHRTISEAFPNQFPSLLLDDAPTNSASETDPRTPEIATPAHGYFGTEDLEHDTVGPSLSCSHASKRNDAFSEHSDPVSSRNSPKHNSLFRSLGPKKSVKGKVRKGLKFYEVAKSELVSKLEKEILHSKEALVKLESEKEAGLKQYQRSLEHLSRQKAAVSRAEEDSQELTEQASKAETEIQALKKALFNLEAEKEVSLLQYQLCLEKISNLQDILSHAQKDAGDLDIRTNKAEADTRTLKQDLAKVEAEKDVVLNQYKQSLELTTNLEKKLLLAEERAQKYCERAEVAECEVQTLKVAISKLIEAKEAAALNYEKCLETISSLELKISSTHEDVQNLSGEIDSKVEKLLHSELKTLVLRMDTQDEELTEKQRELGKLWACIQEERLRFMEAETAFQSLQLVHSQAQEDLSSLASELQSMAYILRNVETHNDSLQVERLKLKNENKSLNELNLSSTMSMKGIENEIDRLKKTNRKLEEEVELQVDQRNSFQQEIYCLKEELRDLNHKHLGFSNQVDAVGLSQDCFETSVKELQDENSNLGILCQRERSDRVALSEKMEKLLDKNALLENSLLNMGDELEAARRRINVLEESCHSLLQEKSSVLDENASLMTQLQLTTENLGKHLEKNTILENTLCDTLDQLEVSEEKVKSLRDSCLLLANQKTGLISEKNTLVSQVEMMHQSLSNSEKRSTELEEKCSVMEKDRKSTTIEVKGLKNHLEMQKQEQLNFAQMSNTQLACLVHQVHLLQDEILNKYRELDGELGNALHYEVENFVLQRCVHDLRDKNSVLLIECEKLSETSKLSENLISELEQENLEEHLEVKSLFDQHNSLMSQLSKAFYIVSDQCCEDIDRPEKTSVDYIISSVHDLKSSLSETQDENQLLAVEMSVLVVLIDQLKLEASHIQMEKSIADHELRIRSEQCLMFESESRKLSKMTEELILKVMDGYHKEEELMTRMENLHGMLLVIQEAYDSLQKEKVLVVEEKQVLMKELLDMRKKNHTIEEEKHTINSDMFSLDILSLIFKKYVDERSTEMKKLCEDLHKLRGVNAALEKERSITEEKLDDLEVENLHLKEKLHESDTELRAVTSVVGKLNQDIANSKDLLCQKEMDLSEAEHDIIIRENENSCFAKEMENLRWEHDAVQMIREDLEKQMVKLREDSAHVLKENQCLGEAKQKFEVELTLLHGLYETSRNKENFLFSEVQKKNDEINLWQTQATTLYGELQTSTITRTLLEDKVNELIGKCNSLHDGNTMKDVKIELLGERIGILEGKNKGLKSQLVSLGPAVTSLMDTVSSLEMHTFMHKNIQEPGYEDIKEVELADQNIILPYALSNMQDLQARVKAIEKTIIEMARLATQENLNAYNKLESTAKQMEELRSENRSLKGKVQPISEISEASGVLPKDIMLDHISESSFYGTSRRHYVGPDNQMLELWETVDENSSIDLSIGKGKKVVGAHTKNERFEAVKLKSETSSSNLLIEKELGMNILEISKKFRETRQEGNKRKVLERLNSDVQKLTNLRITVQDLKRKVATIEKSRNSKAITESDSVKQKLEDAEAAIQKLFDLNGKLVKNVEDNSTYSGKISSVDSGDSGSVRRKRISEQARRVSEKIGRLQLEIQRIQFDLLKVDDVKESIGKFRLTDTRRKVLLRDYIYTGPKNTPRRKKATFCACMEPPTKGD